MSVTSPQEITTPKRKTAGIILIGNELLSGQTADLNLNHIAKKLFNHGIDLMETIVIPDLEDEIIRVVRDYSKRFSYVFTTGGIGPTHDDITAETLSKAFGRAYTQNQQAYEILRAKYGDKDFTDSRGRMTMMPEGSELIYNDATAAPGFRVENVYVMAGIPYIMQTMLDHALDKMIPSLLCLFKWGLSNPFFIKTSMRKNHLTSICGAVYFSDYSSSNPCRIGHGDTFPNDLFVLI